MDDKYRLVRKHSEVWRTLRDGDFEEEEIWDVVKEREDYTCEEVFHHKAKNKELSSLPIPIGSRTIPIPRTSSESSSANSSHETRGFQQSAPVNIPDWSKIYGGNDKVKKSVKNVSRYSNDNYGYYDDHDDHEDGDDEVLNHGGDDDDEDEDEDEDEYGTRLPPHEIIARRLARSQISSFSVFEGVGRTLKGRDLSKVRNSVLIKTGFLESL